MAKGYWIARMDVFDPENYIKEYVSRNAEPIAAHKGRFLVRGGKATQVEGMMRDRNIVIEFPSYDDALACLNSPKYQEAMEFRRQYGRGDLVIVEGYDGPQPGQS
ncbi:MAG: DUF1330 domain-containing protein [Pseudomonadota bacterium]